MAEGGPLLVRPSADVQTLGAASEPPRPVVHACVTRLCARPRGRFKGGSGDAGRRPGGCANRPVVAPGRHAAAGVRCQSPPGRWRALWPRVAWRHNGCSRGRRRPTRERGGPPLRNREATPTGTVGGWLILANDTPTPGCGARLALLSRADRSPCLSGQRSGDGPRVDRGIRPIVDRSPRRPAPAQRGSSSENRPFRADGRATSGRAFSDRAG
jgi:hypothetical protein